MFLYRPSPQFRRGYNLIEATIVLAVVALVIGGMWGVTASVKGNMRLNAHVSAMIQIIQGARSLFSGNGYPAVANTTSHVSMVLLNARITPSDWSTPNNYSLTTSNGYNLEVYQANNGAYLTGATATNIGILVLYYSLTESQCIELVTAVGSRFKDTTDLAAINVSGTPTISSFPVSLQTAKATCVANTAANRKSTIPTFGLGLRTNLTLPLRSPAARHRGGSA